MRRTSPACRSAPACSALGSLALLAPNGGTGPIALPGTAIKGAGALLEDHRLSPQWSYPGGAVGPFTWGWLGDRVVYATQGAPSGSDLVLSTNDGATVGLVAPGTALWGVSDLASPTRIFFSRPGDGGGLWWSNVP